MKNKTTLQINFFDKHNQNGLKDPVEFELTELNNNSYTLSEFGEYESLHGALSDWLERHYKPEIKDNFQQAYNDFLLDRQQIDQVLNVPHFFLDVPNESVSSPLLDSIGNLSCMIDNGEASIIFSMLDSEIKFENERKYETIRDENGTYEGYAINSIADGFGCHTEVDGTRSIGQWKNGGLIGKGFMYSPCGSYYYGDYINNKGEGKGEYKYDDGGIYIGEFKEGKRSGYGKYTYADGTIYKGYWKDGLEHGEGIGIYDDGEEVIGTWFLGEFIEDDTSSENHSNLTEDDSSPENHPNLTFFDDYFEFHRDLREYD